jgi:hypothetical protein
MQRIVSESVSPFWCDVCVEFTGITVPPILPYFKYHLPWTTKGYHLYRPTLLVLQMCERELDVHLSIAARKLQFVRVDAS